VIIDFERRLLKMLLAPKKLKDKMRGVLHLVMTPFKEGSEELDEEALREGLRFSIKGLKGEDAVFIALGSTGEFYAVNDEEFKRVAEITVEEVNGEFPVLIGTGQAGTKITIERSKFAEKIGADGVMVVLPYYHLVTRDGIYRHYKKVAESINIGVMVYNNPEVSKLYIEPDLMVRLSKIENIIAEKENTPKAEGYYWMQRMMDPNDMVIVCGLGQLMYPFEALFGCPGYVTELANFVPSMAVALYKAAIERNFDKLVELANKIAPYHEFIGRVASRRSSIPCIMSPHITIEGLPYYQAVCKTAMDLIGIPGGKVREPMESLTSEEKEELREILKNMRAL
jgi:4-hydroxy-tetrahydrodipicolinate synthase